MIFIIFLRRMVTKFLGFLNLSALQKKIGINAPLVSKCYKGKIKKKRQPRADGLREGITGDKRYTTGNSLGTVMQNVLPFLLSTAQ